MPARGEPYAEPYAEIRKVSARERLERLPLEWALEDEHRAMAAQINRSAGATLRASEEARAVELGRRQSEAAAWRSGEPVGAACVLALALLAWCVCRRRRRIRMVPSAAELDVADKRRHAAEEEGTTADASGAAPAPRRGAPVIPRSVNVLLRRAFRQLRALVLLVASPCPRLALALRSWLGTDPKRRDSSFTAPPPACLVVGSSAADDAAIRSTTRSVAPSEHGHGAPRHADASAIEAPDASPSLFGSTSDPPTVLSRAQLAQLARALPARLAIRDWSLAFSTDQHGCSLNTFFARAVRACAARARAWHPMRAARPVEGGLARAWARAHGRAATAQRGCARAVSRRAGAVWRKHAPRA